MKMIFYVINSKTNKIIGQTDVFTFDHMGKIPQKINDQKNRIARKASAGGRIQRITFSLEQVKTGR